MVAYGYKYSKPNRTKWSILCNFIKTIIFMSEISLYWKIAVVTYKSISGVFQKKRMLKERLSMGRKIFMFERVLLQ